MLQDAKTSNRGGGVRLVIVGASASALALASHLLRRDARAQIVLIEADAERCAALREGATRRSSARASPTRRLG
ncbi:hypothetical protein [Methylobacterium gregans]|uniref:hypothetical protein n=1 Tax=Methylobacterium gregans TaxID=374424 RepID=UPI003618C8E2